MSGQSQRFDPRQTMHQRDFEIFHYKEPKPEAVEVHHHDFYEVYLFLGGEAEYWVEGHLYHLKPGDLLLINPRELHRPILKDNASVYERIVLWIDKKFLDSLSSEVNLTNCFDNTRPTHTNLLRPTLMQRSEIITRMNNLVHEFYGTDYGNHLYASGILLQFLVELNRMAFHSESRQEERTPQSQLVSDVLAYINEHYADNLSLENIATRFFVSKYHLSHEFTRAVGVGVYRYIVLKRLLIAKQMLTDGMTPGEVYGKCGFGDYTAFFRAFKAEYGISPGSCVPGK